jgi:hypothetical protein
MRLSFSEKPTQKLFCRISQRSAVPSAESFLKLSSSKEDRPSHLLPLFTGQALGLFIQKTINKLYQSCVLAVGE